MDETFNETALVSVDDDNFIPVYIPDMGRQDVNDPIQADFKPDTGSLVSAEDMDDLRTNSGTLDFLTGVSDKLHDWVAGETDVSRGPKYDRYKPPKIKTMNVREEATDYIRTGSLTLDTAGDSRKLVEATPYRRRLTLVVRGQIVWLSNDTIASSPGGVPVMSPNEFELPVSSAVLYFPVPVHTRDALYVRAAVANARIDWIEEFDEEC
jgi:hypothetical protein